MTPEDYEDWLDLMGRGYYPPKPVTSVPPANSESSLPVETFENRGPADGQQLLLWPSARRV